MGVAWGIPNMEDKSSLSPFQQVRQGLGLTVVLHIGIGQVSSVPEWNSNLPTPDWLVPYLHREVEDQSMIAGYKLWNCQAPAHYVG
jgi:hypothetical protein